MIFGLIILIQISGLGLAGMILLVKMVYMVQKEYQLSAIFLEEDINPMLGRIARIICGYLVELAETRMAHNLI